MEKYMESDHNTNMAMIKITLAWVGATIGAVSLTQWVLISTLIFTLLQILVLIRKIWKGLA
jgi:hypothetical protein